MTAPEGTRRRRIWAMGLAAVAVAAATVVGSFSYADHVRDLSRDRAEISERVCERQDQVIDVLRVLVSDERERLAFPEGNAGLARSSFLVRRQIDRILASPCEHSGGGK